MERFTNEGSTTLGSGIDNAVTSLTVASSASFPSAGDFRVRIDSEILIVTAVSGTTWTVTRGAEGTTAASHSSGAAVTHVLTKGGLEGIVGNMVQTGTFSARPAAGIPGRWYLPTDGPVIFFDDGTNWLGYGPCYPLTPPVAADFAWVNQGGASLIDSHGAIRVVTTPTGGDNLRIQKKTAPATPYTITAGFIVDFAMDSAAGVGLCLRQSSDGKLVVMTLLAQNAAQAYIITGKYNSPTSFSANYALLKFPAGGGRILWLQFEDNGTTRYMRWSWDGINWYLLHSVGRTDFCTPDEVGWYVQGSTSSVDAAGTLVSWKQT